MRQPDAPTRRFRLSSHRWAPKSKIGKSQNDIARTCTRLPEPSSASTGFRSTCRATVHRASLPSPIPKLRAALGLEPRTVDVYDPVQQLAIVHDDVLDRLGVDTIEMGRAFCHEDKWWTDWTLPDGTPAECRSGQQPERNGNRVGLARPSGRIMARMPEVSVTFDQVYWPFLDGDEDLSKIEALFPSTCGPDMPSPPGPSISGPEELATGARALRASTSRAIIGVFGGKPA